VSDELSLTGGAQLGPVANTNGSIGINNGSTVIRLASDVADNQVRLPKLNLGEIGAMYSDEPAAIILTVAKKDFPQAQFDALNEEVLVEGRNLSNCEDWRVRVKFPQGEEANFEAYCWTDGTASGQKIPMALGLTRLLLRKKLPAQTDPPQTPPEAGGLSTGAKVAIGIVVPVVVIAIVVAVILVMKKGGGGGSSSASSGGGPGNL
jgi:hypothetical protein